MKRALWLVAAAALPLTALLAPVGAARADQVDPGSGEGGYSVSVQVRFTGSAAPGDGGGSTKSVTMHPVCWWEPAPGEYTDPKAMLEWYDGVTGGVQSPGMLAQYGPRSIWEDAVARQAAGQKLAWYKAFCYDPSNYVDYGLGGGETGYEDPIDGVTPTWAIWLYRAFGVGDAIPAPMVSVEELAEVAYDNMDIPEPEIDRNPKVTATDDATLVGLPTYFWVTNPAALGEDAGGGQGELSIRATVAGTDVWAEVRALTGGLELTWPNGSASCSRAEALTKYDENNEGAGCTVEFEHASTGYPGGYPVKAGTAWSASWTSSDPGEGGDLPGQTSETTVQIPVAEVQNIVKP